MSRYREDVEEQPKSSKFGILMLVLLVVGIACMIATPYIGVIPFVIAVISLVVVLIWAITSKVEVGSILVIAVAICLVILGIMAALSFVTVSAGNKAVITNTPDPNMYGETLDEGWHWNPVYLTSEIEKIRYNTQTESFVGVDLADDNAGSIWVLSNDSVGIFLDFSIIYNLPSDKVSDIRFEYGPNYVNDIIVPIGRSIPRDVCAQYTALDIVGDKRPVIEKAIKEGITAKMKIYGFNCVDVALRDIRPPQTMIDAIEAKKVAEQGVITAEYNKQKVVIDAQAAMTRVLIEANATAQATITKANGSAEAIGLIMDMFKSQNPNSTDDTTAQYLQWLFIQALTDPNSNISFYIVPTDGGTPIIVNPNTQPV